MTHHRATNAKPYLLIKNLLIDIKRMTSHALQELRMRELPGQLRLGGPLGMFGDEGVENLDNILDHHLLGGHAPLIDGQANLFP